MVSCMLAIIIGLWCRSYFVRPPIVRHNEWFQSRGATGEHWTQEIHTDDILHSERGTVSLGHILTTEYMPSSGMGFHQMARQVFLIGAIGEGGPRSFFGFSFGHGFECSGKPASNDNLFAPFVPLPHQSVTYWWVKVRYWAIALPVVLLEAYLAVSAQRMRGQTSGRRLGFPVHPKRTSGPGKAPSQDKVPSTNDTSTFHNR
jgi:hypothetical protein